MLRFSRLFKPVHYPHIWKRKKKRKTPGEEDGEQKDKEDKNDEEDIEPKESAMETETNSDFRSKYGSDVFVKIDEGYGDSDSDNSDDDFGLKLDMGRPPLNEDCLSDDEVCFFFQIDVV